MARPQKLKDDEIIGRVRLGIRHMKKFVALDRNACSCFRDPSTLPQWIDRDEDEEMNFEGDEVAGQTVEGQPNILQINILTKVAAIGIGDPDWHVTADDANVQKIARQYLRNEWKKRHWKKQTNKALLKRYVAGLGFIAYRWDALTGPDFKHKQSWEMAVDPFHTDWHDLNWAAWRIRMPLRQAIALYPDKKGALPGPREYGSQTEATLDVDKVYVWLYFSKDQTYEQGEEVHILGTKDAVQKEVLFRGKNLYGRVPLLAIEGDIDPGPSEFPISDHVLARGLQAEYSDLVEIISNKAKHGGPVTFFTQTGLSKGAVEALENGKQQGWVPKKGTIMQDQPPAWRLPGEPITQPELEAKKEALNALDAATACTSAMRGQPMEGVEFATEVAYVQGQSGARQVQMRRDFEDLNDEMAETCIDLYRKFGGKRRDMQIPQEQQVLHDALSQVLEVQVVEHSTVYKDPNQQQQQTMQRYNIDLQSMQLYLAMAGMGIIEKIPNISKTRDDLNRAFGIDNTDECWTQAPQGQPGGQGQGKEPRELIDYKDAPPDIRRQMEQQAGMQPSQMEQQSPAALKAMGSQTGGEQESLMPLVQQKHEQNHELISQLLKQHHEVGLKKMELESQQAQAKIAAVAAAKKTASNGSRK